MVINNNIMILHVYEGEWGLPSIDLDSIKLLTVVKLSNAPVEVNKKGNPFNSPNGFLPYLSVNDKKICGYNSIISYFKKQGYDVNKDLSIEQNNLVLAYMYYFEKNLFPYFYYYFWGEPINAEETRTIYAKKTPFPFNFYSPKKYIEKANKMTEIFFNFSLFEKIDTHNIDQIIIDARIGVNLLSEKLGDKKWFLGNEFSECDATIYAYLSLLHKTTLKENPIRAHISECPNLVNYIDRITNLYFPNELNTIKIESNLPTKLSEDDAETLTWKTKVLAGVFGVFALASFALYKGILSISADDDEYSNMGNYYDDDDETDGSDD